MHESRKIFPDPNSEHHPFSRFRSQIDHLMETERENGPFGIYIVKRLDSISSEREEKSFNTQEREPPPKSD